MHTAALVVMGRDKRDEETIVEGDGNPQSEEKEPGQAVAKEVKEVPVAVVEQRVSNLVQGSICESVPHILAPSMLILDTGLVLMTGPFQTVLAQIPKGVLSGKSQNPSFPQR